MNNQTKDDLWSDYLKAVSYYSLDRELQLIRDHVWGLVEREYNRKTEAPESAKCERPEGW